MKITSEEKKLIKCIRKIQWGTIEEILVQKGVPVRIKRVIQNIKIDI